MSNTNAKTLSDAMEIVRSCLAQAQDDIFSELESAINPETVKTRNGNRIN